MKSYKEMKKIRDDEDRAIRGAIAWYQTVKKVPLATLASIMGVSLTTMYQRIKNPGSMTLGEYRKLYNAVHQLRE